MGLWFLQSREARVAALRSSTGRKLEKNVRRLLDAPYREGRDAAIIEGLSRGSAELRQRVLASLQSSHVSLLRLLDLLPSLVELAASDADCSVDARQALEYLRVQIPDGRDACPQCLADSARVGNATGWTCNKCSLNYKGASMGGPLNFNMAALFDAAPPWKPAATIGLIREIEAKADRSQKEWQTSMLSLAHGQTELRRDILRRCTT